MPDVTSDVQRELDDAIDQVSKTPTRACIAGFVIVGSYFGASSGAGTFGTTTIPGWFAGGALGLAVGGIICNVVKPIETQIQSFKVGQATPVPPVHVIGFPPNMSVATNISPQEFIAGLRRIRGTIQVRTEQA